MAIIRYPDSREELHRSVLSIWYPGPGTLQNSWLAVQPTKFVYFWYHCLGTSKFLASSSTNFIFDIIVLVYPHDSELNNIWNDSKGNVEINLKEARLAKRNVFTDIAVPVRYLGSWLFSWSFKFKFRYRIKIKMLIAHVILLSVLVFYSSLFEMDRSADSSCHCPPIIMISVR